MTTQKKRIKDIDTIILEEYLKRYTPVDKYTPGVIILSTSDIISDLSDMTDLSPVQVNRVLSSLGYTPGRNHSGSFGWMVRPAPVESN